MLRTIVQWNDFDPLELMCRFSFIDNANYSKQDCATAAIFVTDGELMYRCSVLKRTSECTKLCIKFQNVFMDHKPGILYI